MLGSDSLFRRQVSLQLFSRIGSARDQLLTSRSKSATGGDKQQAANESDQETTSSFENTPPPNASLLHTSIATSSHKLSRIDQAKLTACALSYATTHFPSLLSARSLSPAANFHHPAPLTLILDLDETCVRSMINYGVVTPTDAPTTDVGQATVFYRPFLVTMLRALRSLNVEVLVFTASHQTYSDAILDIVDPRRDLIHERYYRQHTVPHPTRPNVLCKDLSILGRNLNRCLLIDDLPDSSAHNPTNAWPIMPYSKALRCGAVSNVVGRRLQEARFRKYCAPVLLTPSMSGLQRSVMGVQQPDYAFLNLFALIKMLLNSGCDVPTFTQQHSNDIHTALVTGTSRMWLPSTTPSTKRGVV